MGLGVVNPNPYSGMGLDYFPMYCPMLACNTTYAVYERPEDQPRYIENTGMNGFVRVMFILYQFAIRERVQVDDSFFYAFRALAVLAEAVRLMVCSMRFEYCAGSSSLEVFNRSDPFAGYAAHDYHTFMRNEACTMASNAFVVLHKHLDGVLAPLADGTIDYCRELFLQRSFSDMLLKVPSLLLDSIVRKVTQGDGSLSSPDSGLVKPLGNDNTRFDFESFFTDSRFYWDVPYDAQRFSHIRYPTLWSPQKICKPGRFEQVIPGYRAPLIKWQYIVRLHPDGWAINFGAADGACGLNGDWNHDPANCLLRQGRSGIVIEGDDRRLVDLNTTFGNRTDIFQYSRALPLEDVQAEMRLQVEREHERRRNKTLQKNNVRQLDALGATISEPRGAGSGQFTISVGKGQAEMPVIGGVRVKTVPQKASGNFDYAPVTAYSPEPSDVDPALVKMDIDNADCRYLDAALEVVRPLVIFFEIVADIPPPFDYREKYRPPYSPAPNHMPGCSVQAFVNIGRVHGYTLTEVLLEDAVLVRDDWLHVGRSEDVYGMPVDASASTAFLTDEVENAMWAKVAAKSAAKAKQSRYEDAERNLESSSSSAGGSGSEAEEEANFHTEASLQARADAAQQVVVPEDQEEVSAPERSRAELSMGQPADEAPETSLSVAPATLADSVLSARTDKETLFAKIRPLSGMELKRGQKPAKDVPYGFPFYDARTGNGRVYLHPLLYCQFGTAVQEKLSADPKKMHHVSSTSGDQEDTSQASRPSWLRRSLAECYRDLSVVALYGDGFFCHPKQKWVVRPEKDVFDWSLLMDQSMNLEKRAGLIHEVTRARRWKAGLRGPALEDNSAYTLHWPE
ncbi:unnamed protein product [Amoebophrya sp. A25]|nr:unnamed protein product [Amoebophrya sp. A25]|eukprot:GSA25T00017625001.1